MKIACGMRWGLVTFALGLSCGVLGHYLPSEIASGVVFLLSALFGLFGGLAINDDK